MDQTWLDKLLPPYNPWWNAGQKWEQSQSLPSYRRPIVSEVLTDLRELSQIISVTGPRRVGKSTALKQAISHLIQTDRVPPARIMYFSFDDPELFASEKARREVFDLLIERFQNLEQPAYFFLDEIQRFPKWELYLKKSYDLKRPIRFVISGSASSPIFRSSQESLLGRIKDRHLLPFSFREFCQYHLRESPGFAPLLEEHRQIKHALLAGDGHAAKVAADTLHGALEPYHHQISQAVNLYCVQGGFPEIWALPDSVRKIEYLMEQQVRKVIYEDLMLLTRYRRPENVLRFFVYLLSRPGIELNLSKASAEIGVERRLLEDNLPLFELTDLIMRIQRFSNQPARIRRGHIKCYPIDMALRNAVLKSWDFPSGPMLGMLAENLVVRELGSWPEKIELSYFRDKSKEVDFILTHGGNRHLPIEVKCRDQIEQQKYLIAFMRKYRLKLGVVVTRDQEPSFEEMSDGAGILNLPLRYFLLGT